MVRRRWRRIAIRGYDAGPASHQEHGPLAAPHEVGGEGAADLDLVPLDEDVVEVRGDLAILQSVDGQLDLPPVERR
jgi:hypothetical protein